MPWCHVLGASNEPQVRCKHKLSAGRQNCWTFVRSPQHTESHHGQDTRRETIMAEFPDIEGKTVLAAIALPSSLLTRYRPSQRRTVQLIHHADDRLCVWTPSKQVLRMLQQNGFNITYITGWRAYLGTAQHNYPHWTRAALPQGQHDIAEVERIPGVLPFSVYAQAPLRLISWCSFELPQVAKQLLRRLAIMCESPETATHDLVRQISQQAPHVCTELDATQYLATLATVSIATRAKMPTYTTMVQQFLGTLQLPMAIYMLDWKSSGDTAVPGGDFRAGATFWLH